MSSDSSDVYCHKNSDISWFPAGVFICIFIQVNQFVSLLDVLLHCPMSNCFMILESGSSITSMKNGRRQIMSWRLLSVVCAECWKKLSLITENESFFVCVKFCTQLNHGKGEGIRRYFVISMNDITSKESRFLGEFDTKLKSDKRIKIRSLRIKRNQRRDW